MGNIKNRAKRNKRKAANWRGIIRMRKPKIGSLKNTNRKNEIPVATTVVPESVNEQNGCPLLDDSQTHSQVDIDQNTNNSAEFATSEEDINVEETLHHTVGFDKWIEVGRNYNEAQVNDGNLCDANVCEDQVQNQESIEPNWNIYEIVTTEDAFDLTFDFNEWIEVDEDYVELQINSFATNESNEQAQLNVTDQIECEIHHEIHEQSRENVESTTNHSSEFEDCSDDDSVTEEDEDDPTNTYVSDEENENSEADRNENNISDDDTEMTGSKCSDDAVNIRVNVTGRRIVDMNFVFNQIKDLNQHSHSDACNFNDMEVVKETKMGLRTLFAFRCRVCGFEQKVDTCEKNPLGSNVNKAAALGITSTGSGFYNLEEFCAHLDIPCMSDKTFQKNNKALQKDWWELAQSKANEALLEEIRLAKVAGDVDSKGNALVIVIVDGSWGKRSYGKGYSSLSGCAVLIGYRTKKIIYVGVKNKYCQYCANSYAMMCPPNKHPCNINYDGASSGMETAIVVEGFKYCATLGARFPILVADGDASTYKELRELRLYKDPVIVIQKYECVNHLFKNFRKKFKALGFNTKYAPGARKYITQSKGNEICTGIRMAAKHWRESDLSQSEKFTKLETDCMNAAHHYFGQHDNCDPYFCDKETTPKAIELINQLKTAKIFQAVLSLCQDYFACHVKSLLANYNTNDAEGFNSVVAKFLGGKRINYSLAGSYKGRIGMAVVQHNTEYHGGSEFHKTIFGNHLDSCKKLEDRRKRKLKLNAIARKKKPRKKPVFDKEASQVGYGEGCQKPDKTGREFELAVKHELAKLEENRKDRESIVRDTSDRENCNKWHEVRQNIISSFYFARIVNANSPKSYSTLTFEILYNSKEFANTAERRHYQLHESDALNDFKSIYKDHDLEKCGIFIDRDLCFLGSTPLRLYGPDSIVAVRCPLKCFNKSIDDAIASNAINFWKRKKGNEEVFFNEKSAWYLEIQGELHVSDRKWAYLVVWLGEGNFKIEKIERNYELWDSLMKPKLIFFFEQSMIKELADPRRDRKMKLREFDTQQNTFV